LTTDDIGDPTPLPDLLDQIYGPVNLVLADGGYDCSPTGGLLAQRLEVVIEVTILSPKNAIFSPNAAWSPTVSDRPIAEIQALGRHWMAEDIRLYSSQQWLNPNGTLKDCYLTQTESLAL
jgi:hypothetical protein